MSALTAGKRREYRGGYDIDLPVAASTTIYQGGMVTFTQGTEGVAAGTASATEKFVGFANETVVNAGSAGDEIISIHVGGEALFTAASVTQATFGGYVMDLSDDDTVALSGSASVVVGMATTAESTTEVWVLLSPFGAVGA